MRFSKILSVLAIVLLASQTICGFYLTNNPEAAAAGSADFHMTLGLATLATVIAATVSVFRTAKKTLRGV